jgi:hypothetical protein
MDSEEGTTDQRSGTDRRRSVDPRNPELQSWMRKFWSRFYKDNPDKDRRGGTNRRQSEKRSFFARLFGK